MSDTPVSLIPAPCGYAEWLIDLKSRIHKRQRGYRAMEYRVITQ